MEEPSSGGESVSKRFLREILSAVIVALMMPLAPNSFLNALDLELHAAHADTTLVASGAFPSNAAVCWTLDSDGLLTISGSGTVTDCRDSFSTNLWSNYAEKIKSVSMASTVKPTTMKCWFYDCCYLTSANTADWDTSNVTNMDSMFCFCCSLTSLDLSSFDTSNVTSMQAMFLGCFYLTSLDLSNFDTSNVVDMSGMFMSCCSLPLIELSSFDTSKVTDMTGVFWQCYSLKALDISGWDISNVTDMQCMFEYCSSLRQITFGPNWSFKSPTKLPSSHTWRAVGSGTVSDPKGSMYSASELASAWKPTMADTYVWIGLGIGKSGVAGSSATKAIYKATSLNTCAYMKPYSRSSSTYVVPSTVSIKGKTYKITQVAALGFRGLKVSSLMIGANVTRIGSKAFYGCRNLKKIGVTTAKLTKSGVKGSLTGSKIQVVKLTGAARTKYSTYKKYFSKANCGKLVTVRK